MEVQCGQLFHKMPNSHREQNGMYEIINGNAPTVFTHEYMINTLTLYSCNQKMEDLQLTVTLTLR